LHGRRVSQAEVDRIVRARDFQRIAEVLIFADMVSSIRMSVAIGFYHRYGCMEGVMIHDRTNLDAAEIKLLMSRELVGEFTCNRCRRTESLSVSWIKDGYEKDYFPLTPPPSNPVIGIQLALHELVRLEALEPDASKVMAPPSALAESAVEMNRSTREMMNSLRIFPNRR
jgi:hypothetical protein